MLKKAQSKPLMNSEIRNRENLAKLIGQSASLQNTAEKRRIFGATQKHGSDMMKRIKSNGKLTYTNQGGVEKSLYNTKPLSGILSDSERKNSRKVKPRGSIAFDANTKQGDDEEALNSMQGATTPGESLMELCGDVKPDKQDNNFSKVARKVKKEMTPLFPDNNSKSASVIPVFLDGDNSKRELMTIESKSDSNSHTGKNIGQQSRDSAQPYPEIQVINNDTKSNILEDASMAGVVHDSDAQIAHNQFMTYDSMHEFTERNLQKSRALSVAKPQHCSSSMQEPLPAIDNKPRASMKLLEQREIEFSKPNRDIYSPQFKPKSRVDYSAIPTSRNASCGGKLTDFVSGSQKVLSDPISNFSTARKQNELNMKTPKTAVSAIEKAQAQYEERRRVILEEFETGKISSNIFQKRNERILKEKLAAIEEIQQKEKNKAYKTHLRQTKKEKSLPGIKMSATSHKFVSPRNNNAVANKKRSDMRKSDKVRGSFEANKATKPFVTFDNYQSEKRNHHELNTKLSSVQTHQSLPKLMPLTAKSGAKAIGSGSQNQEVIASRYGNSVNLSLKPRGKGDMMGGGSNLFKTVDSKSTAMFKTMDSSKHMMGSGLVGGPLGTARNLTTLLSMDTNALREYNLQKSTARGSSMPPASIKEDLEEHQINFKIGDRQNPAGVRRTVKNPRAGSSLPSQLVLRDKDGKTSVKVPENENRLNSDLEDVDDDVQTRNGQKIMKLSKMTKKQNQFLNKFVNLNNQVVNPKMAGSTEHLGSTYDQNIPKNIFNADITVSTMSIPDTSLYQTSSGGDLQKKRKQTYSTFETQLNAILQSNSKNSNINKLILKQVSNPEVVDYPDFPKVALQATSTEIKTILYELKRLMNSQAMILTLESMSSTQDIVKNENIELIPRLPIQCKVSIKERIAPLKLRFDFYDSQTKEKIRNPDVVVCLSSTLQSPTLETAQIIKTEFKDPNVWMFRELNGKMIPEFNPSNKKDKFPQQVYLSLESMTGCLCTISVSFPFEDKQKKAEQTENPRQLVKQKIGAGQLSKEEERFKELQTIIAMKKISYRKSYDLNKKFIKEEIQKLCDHQGYVCQAMKQSDETRLKKKKERLEQRKENERKRALNEEEGIINFMMRHRQMSSDFEDLPQHVTSLDERQILERIQFSNGEQLSVQMKEELRRKRQQFKREIMMVRAKELRKALDDERQKMRLLYLLKQDLLKTYRENEYTKYDEYRAKQKVAQKWIVLTEFWGILTTIWQKYQGRSLEEKIKQEKEAKSRFLQKHARRFLSNFEGKRGRSYEDRMLRHVCNSMGLVGVIKNDQAVGVSKDVMFRFLQAMSTSQQLGSRIRQLVKAVSIVKRSWNRYKFKFLIREAILKSRMEQAKQGIWFKEANNKKNKVVMPIDRKEYIRNSMRIYENEELEEITLKNLKLFSNFIKIESTLFNALYRIEKVQCEAKTILRKIEREEAVEREMRLKEGKPVDFDETQSLSSDESREEFKENQRLRDAQKQKQLETIERMKQWRMSSYLKVIEQKYDQVMKQATRLDQDRCNYSVFVWKGLEGYEKIVAGAQNYKKGQKSHATGKANKKDKHTTNYRKHQAEIVSKAFEHWLRRRKRDFNEQLQESVARQDFSNFELRRVKGKIVYTPPNASRFLPIARFTQPEETAFMFLKIMDEIHVWQDHQDRISKKQHLREQQQEAYNIMNQD